MVEARACDINGNYHRKGPQSTLQTLRLCQKCPLIQDREMMKRQKLHWADRRPSVAAVTEVIDIPNFNSMIDG